MVIRTPFYRIRFPHALRPYLMYNFRDQLADSVRRPGGTFVDGGVHPRIGAGNLLKPGDKALEAEIYAVAMKIKPLLTTQE